MKRIVFTIIALITLTTSAYAFEGAVMRKAFSGGNPVDQAIPNATAPYATLTFNQAVYDTGSFWNYTRNCFEIPAGVSYARFVGQVVFAHNTSGIRQLLINRSAPGSTVFDWFPGGVVVAQLPAIAGTTTDLHVSGPVVKVTQGECYALQPYQDSGTTVMASGGIGTWFSMEVIE